MYFKSLEKETHVNKIIVDYEVGATMWLISSLVQMWNQTAFSWKKKKRLLDQTACSWKRLLHERLLYQLHIMSLCDWYYVERIRAGDIKENIHILTLSLAVSFWRSMSMGEGCWALMCSSCSLFLNAATSSLSCIIRCSCLDVNSGMSCWCSFMLNIASSYWI